MPVIVMKHKQSKALAAHATPYKGGDHDWSIEQCARDIIKWGLHGDLIIKTDQGDALKALVDQMIRVLVQRRKMVAAQQRPR